MHKLFIFISGFSVSTFASIFIINKIHDARIYPISSEGDVFAENQIIYVSKQKSLWFRIKSNNAYLSSSSFDEFRAICVSVGLNPTEFTDDIQGNRFGENKDGVTFRFKHFIAPEFIDRETYSLILEDNHYFWGNYITKDNYGDVVHNIYYFPKKDNKHYGYIVLSNIRTR